MNQTLKIIILVVILIAIFIGAGLGYKHLSKDYDQPTNTTFSYNQNQNANSAPDFTVKNTDGESVSLSDLKGKPVVINFWATWCGYCVKEFPHFQDMYKKYGDEIEFMMVDLVDGNRETEEVAKSFIKSKGYTFPIYFDTTGEAAYNYNAYSIPLSVFVDKDGNLVDSHTGAMDGATLENYIKSLIGE